MGPSTESLALADFLISKLGLQVDRISLAYAIMDHVEVEYSEELSYEDRIAELEEALAARQPVGQITGTEIDARLNALYREMVDSGQHNGGMSGVAWDRAVYRMASSQPAQAVDYQAALLAEERSHSETIDQRDRCEEVADELADHIARITGVDIGEHSSANCPWQNAIEAAEEYKPAQAVDLGQFRPAVECWRWTKAVAVNSGELDTEMKRSALFEVNEADRLLALIDSQDRPNG